MEPKMQLPLFYIYKVLKHKRKIQSNHNRKFQCPFSFCAKGYNHKNKMLAHLHTHVPILYLIYISSEDSTQLDQHIMSHLTNSCSDATTGDSTSQYSFSEGYKNEDMFTMLQKDMTRKEEVFYFNLKEDEELERFFLID